MLSDHGVIKMDNNPLNITLDRDNLHALAYICASDAWVQTFVPFLEGMERSALNDLVDPTEERESKRPTAFLQAQVVIIRAFLSFPEYILEEHRREAEAAEEGQKVEDHYAERVADGQYGPFGGATPNEEDNALM